MKQKFTQCRNWAFTDFELLDIKEIYNKYKDIIRYICWGEEICTKTKKIHYQGWIQFMNKKRIGGVKKCFGSNKIHLESCKGNEFQNNTYCSKDNKFHCFGKFVCQGARTDLEKIKHRIDKGDTLYNIAQDNFGNYIRYHRGFEKYKSLRDKATQASWRNIACTLVQGSTGTGKTRFAYKDPENTFKIQGCELNWWDGYDGEDILLIDEYANDVKITKLLGILDGYPLRLPVKGGFTYANWTTVYITTNLEILHNNASELHISALKRRITTIIKKC